MLRFTIFLMLFSSVVFSKELVVNGDFEQPLGAEWEKKGFTIISNSDTSDPDMEVGVSFFVDESDVCCYLKQRIDISAYSPECITFSCNARLRSYNCNIALYCAAAVIVSYQDKYGNRIADTKIVYIDTTDKYSQKTCWPNDTLQNVSFIQHISWNDYSFNIGEELVSIGLSNVDTIQYVEIALLDTIKHKLRTFGKTCGGR